MIPTFAPLPAHVNALDIPSEKPVLGYLGPPFSACFQSKVGGEF
jgi:hypothetical protein